MTYLENDGYQSRDDIFFNNQEKYPLMGKTEIHCETMQKALS